LQPIGVDPATSESVEFLVPVGSKSAWVEITSATLHDVCGLHYFMGIMSDGGTDDHIIDVGIGAAGSEIVLVENIQTSLAGFRVRDNTNCIYLPIAIKKGERIAVRARAYATAATNRHAMILQYAGGWLQSNYGSSVTYGVNESDCGGVVVDPGNTGNTYGAWSEITASTTKDIQCLILCMGQRDNQSSASCFWRLQVAVGASGSEDNIIADLSMGSHITPDIASPNFHMIKVFIASGSRIAVRSKCTTTSSNDRLLDATIIGFR
jgi:hypothetical protein